MEDLHKAYTSVLKVGDPEYWSLLERSLHNAKDLLWKRLQHGLYADDEEAKATMDAYWALRKVAKLLEEKLHQIPLPEKREDHLSQAQPLLDPEEAHRGSAAQP